jgi:cupin 2 domain-containing protein
MATSTMCAVITAGNLFAALPDASRREQFDTMLMQDGVRLERIVSNGQATPSGEWYDQPQNEWVMLLAGEALIRIEFEEELRRLSVGQWIMLPAHCRHRVEWTSPDQHTVWLALHWLVQ